jgi:hypothetical protein
MIFQKLVGRGVEHMLNACGGGWEGLGCGFYAANVGAETRSATSGV